MLFWKKTVLAFFVRKVYIIERKLFAVPVKNSEKHGMYAYRRVTF